MGADDSERRHLNDFWYGLIETAVVVAAVCAFGAVCGWYFAS